MKSGLISNFEPLNLKPLKLGNSITYLNLYVSFS